MVTDSRSGSGTALNDFVRQVVSKWRRDGKGLHLLRGHHPSQSHPAHVLQAGDAERTLPEVHTAVTSSSSEDISFSREGTAEAVGQ